MSTHVTSKQATQLSDHEGGENWVNFMGAKK